MVLGIAWNPCYTALSQSQSVWSSTDGHVKSTSILQSLSWQRALLDLESCSPSYVCYSLPGMQADLSQIPFNVYMIDAYTTYAASAIAAGNILRSLTAALLPLAGVPMYDRLGYGWGNTLLAFISLGLAGMFILFRRYGEYLRKRFSVQFD